MKGFSELRDSLWILAKSNAAKELRAALGGLDLATLSAREKVEIELLEADLALRGDSGSDQEFWSMKALADALSVEDDALICRARETQAITCRRAGQLDRACGELDRALTLQLSDQARTRVSLRLANYLTHGGKLARSTDLLTEIESRTCRSLAIERRRLHNALFLGDPKAILSSIRRVSRLAPSHETKIKLSCLLARGVANLHLGRCELAAKNFRKARYMNDELFQNTDFDAEARLRQAEALIVKGGHPKRAADITCELVEQIERITSPLLVAEIYRIHARGLRMMGRVAESDAAFESAYDATRPSDRALYRFFALRDHAESLLREHAAGADCLDLLDRVTLELRAAVREFDHPVFEWQVRVFEVLASSRQAQAPELVELEQCKRRLHTACRRGEITEHHRDTWCALLDTDIKAARADLKASLAQDVEAIDEIVAGLRSEDGRAHLREFSRSVGMRLGAERIAMVLEGDAEGQLEVIAAHGLADDDACALAAALMPRLEPDQPILLHDLRAGDDPMIEVVRRALAGAGDSDSLDQAIAAAPDPRSAMAFAIDGGGVVVGLIYVDRPIDRDTLPYRTLDLRDFAFLSNGLAAVGRIALSRVRRQNQALRDRLCGVTRRRGIVTQSAAMARMLERLERVADSTVPILVVGESGTGKELIARAAHAASPRADGPFVAVNCAAIPATLIEAELFGYVRGAFTGADRDKEGYFRAADGGTILLDEIGELPIDLQAKLLRVLEEGRVTPLGRTGSVATDFRVVAATNTDLSAAVDSGAFRPDLYYRLEGFSLVTPPLRDRPEDIRLLAEHFLADNAAAMNLGCEHLRFSAEALRAFERYRWPGNVRELRQAVHACAVLRNIDTGEIEFEALPERIAATATRERSLRAIDPTLFERIATVADEIGTPDLLDEIRDHLTERALENTEGGKRAAARVLGMRESTLRRRLKSKAEATEEGGDH